MLAVVYLSQHRFREAIAAATRCQEVRKSDAALYGILADAHIELGEYEQAFAAIDHMGAARPDAASYSRGSYARELQGDLEGATHLMQMAAEATTPQDPESMAWHHAQLGHLYLEMGRLADARREYEHAGHAFPGHPFANDGLAHVAAAEGRIAEALRIATARPQAGRMPAELAFIGDLMTSLGRNEEAERQYRLAEAGWTLDAPEPTRLARFLAQHHRRINDAVTIAERAAADRQDIFTADALAWAYFNAGRLREARSASQHAIRTGSRDRSILYHAAAIAHAVGDDEQARALVARALDHHPRFDLVEAQQAVLLKESLEQRIARR